MEVIPLVLWIFGTVIAVLGIVLGFLANWNHKNADRISSVEKQLGDIRAENPRLYADHGDVRRVEEQMNGIRHDLTALGAELRASMVSIAEKLNQLIGQAQTRG